MVCSSFRCLRQAACTHLLPPPERSAGPVRERRAPCRPRLARRRWASTMSKAGGSGLGAGDWARLSTSASRRGMRLRRQEVSASSWTSWASVAVAGLYSSRNWLQWRSKAAGSSAARTAVRAVSPWRSALSDERCLPASKRGPVESRELARLTAARSIGTVVVTDILDAFAATGIARRWGGARGGCRYLLIWKQKSWGGGCDWQSGQRPVIGGDRRR